MTRSACSVQRTQGFTLLEMMIALALMSVLFLALFSSFNTIGRGWDIAEKRILASSDMRLVSEFLRSQLSQTMVVRMQGEDGNQIYAFEGADNYVRYAAPLQPLQYQGGIYLIELAVKMDGTARKLEMRYAPYRPEMTWDKALQEAEPVVVYSGVQAARFEYFAADSMDDKPRWLPDWQDKPVYPLLIKLVVEGDDKQGAWPELLIDLPQVDEYVSAG